MREIFGKVTRLIWLSGGPLILDIAINHYHMTSSQHVYEVRPHKDKRDFDLLSDVLPFGRQRHVLDQFATEMNNRRIS